MEKFNFEECYNNFDKKIYGIEYDYEGMFINMINIFLDTYPKEKINKNNFDKFKKDIYFCISYFSKLFFEEDNSNEEDKLNGKEKEKYNYLKKNTEYFIENIDRLEYDENYNDKSIMESLNVILNFITEVNDNFKEINKTMKDTCASLEKFSKNLEINLKIREITEYIKKDQIEIKEIEEYVVCLNNFLKNYNKEDLVKVLSDNKNVDYSDIIMNNGDSNINKSKYGDYLLIETLFTLKKMIQKKIIYT